MGSKKDPVCKTCGMLYELHSGAKCKSCRRPEEHCFDSNECWFNRARMARAKRDAGRQLNDVDVEAIRRYPEPHSMFEE